MDRHGFVGVGCNTSPPQAMHTMPFPLIAGTMGGKYCALPSTSPRMRMARHVTAGLHPHLALSTLVPMCARPSKQQLETLQKQQFETLQQLQQSQHFTQFPFPVSSLLTTSQHKALTSPLGHEPSFKMIGLNFSRDELDMVLYGYVKSSEKENNARMGVALSGLRIGELSYGIDRILGQPSPRSTVHCQIDPSSIEMPPGLEIKQATLAGMIHYGVFCTKAVISKGTKFGPFHGKLVNTSEIKTNDDNSFMWEIFKDGQLSHFIDGRGNSGNWMAYVNCARYAAEQNLIAIQNEGAITYEACKDVPEAAELLVWYGDAYLQFMGIPISLKHSTHVSVDQDDDAGYKCDRCGKVFAYEYYRDKHLKYTRCVDQGDRKFPCGLCTRSFEKRDRLRIHILHVHEKHRPHKCHVCAKSFSQSSSLNKHMRVHSGERPYKCVYCSKAFTASSILRTHIRQHSGEKPFKCKHCGKAFASHAAHDSHVRRTHTKDKVPDINMNSKTDDPIDVVGYEPVCT